MLRSVVGAMAANIMLVQCNFGVPISLACSTWSASVLSTASPEPRPVRTSKAHDQAGRRLEPVSSAGMKHRRVEAEVGVIRPHAVQDHGDAPGQCNHCALCTTTAREFRPPGSQPCRPSAIRRGYSSADCFLTLLIHHDDCCLAQRTAQVDVARLGDPA